MKKNNNNLGLKAIDRTIVALDNMDEEEIFGFLHLTQNKIKYIKIGMEAFYRYGPPLVQKIFKEYSSPHTLAPKIFLDLKLHDIPHTVNKAIKVLQTLPLTFLTIHLTGGEQMLRDAVKAAEKGWSQPLQLLGVTYLTSLGEDDFKKMWDFNRQEVKKSFTNLIQLAYRAGLRGLVLSAHELEWVKEFSKDLEPITTVCPGIRFASEINCGGVSDQKRVATPQWAFAQGADYIVMGRSLTQAGKFLPERLQELSSLFLEEQKGITTD